MIAYLSYKKNAYACIKYEYALEYICDNIYNVYIRKVNFDKTSNKHFAILQLYKVTYIDLWMYLCMHMYVYICRIASTRRDIFRHSSRFMHMTDSFVSH